MRLRTIIKALAILCVLSFSACKGPSVSEFQVNQIIAIDNQSFYAVGQKSIGGIVNGNGVEVFSLQGEIVKYKGETRDTSFGTNGIVDVNFNGLGMDTSLLSAVLDSQGRLVVAGYVYTEDNNSSMQLARYLSDGSFDPAFNGGGPVLVNPTGYCNYFLSVAVQVDGKIVAVGADNMNNFVPFGTMTPEPINWEIQRFNDDGSADLSFGPNGNGTIYVNAGINGYTAASSVVIDANQKILVGGSMSSGTGITMNIERYNSDGSLDTSFGNAGLVTVPQASGDLVDFVPTLALQADGKIILGGTANVNFNNPTKSTGSMLVARYNTNGTLDTSFNQVGYAVERISPVQAGVNDVLFSVAVQPNGQIIATGSANLGNGSPVILRFQTDGTLDATFGSAGISTPALPSLNNEAFGFSTAIQPDGKILIGGATSPNDEQSAFVLFRLWQ